MPYYLWTPWGAWTFATAEPFQTDLSGLMSRLTVSEYIAEYCTRDGTLVGPIYMLLAIEGEKLPVPIALTDREQLLDCNIAKSEWWRLFEMS
jgi:hypothetical protein